MANNLDLNTEFNYAIEYLKNIRKLENQCHAYSMNDDYHLWLKSIKRLHMELCRRMTDKEEKRSLELIKRAENKVNNGNPNDYLRTGNNGREEKHLIQAERHLKKIIKARGMDMPSMEDPGEALLEDT